MKKNKLIDGIIKEPPGGAHNDHKKIFRTVKNQITKCLDKLVEMSPEERINRRIEKYSQMGVVEEELA